MKSKTFAIIYKGYNYAGEYVEQIDYSQHMTMAQAREWAYSYYDEVVAVEEVK